MKTTKTKKHGPGIYEDKTVKINIKKRPFRTKSKIYKVDTITDNNKQTRKSKGTVTKEVYTASGKYKTKTKKLSQRKIDRKRL